MVEFARGRAFTVPETTLISGCTLATEGDTLFSPHILSWHFKERQRWNELLALDKSADVYQFNCSLLSLGSDMPGILDR